jgi:myosin-3
MHPEDLAALEKLNGDAILKILEERLEAGDCHTFVGDVLLVLTPNEHQDIYSDEVGRCQNINSKRSLERRKSHSSN